MENIRVNVNTLAKKLSSKLPNLSHGEALEVISSAAGFGNYRTLKALAEPFEAPESKLHNARAQAMRFAASTFELFDDATMREADHMLDSSECAAIVEALACREEQLAREAQRKALKKIHKPNPAHRNNVETQLALIPMRAHELTTLTDEQAKSAFPAYLLENYEANIRVFGGCEQWGAPVLSIDIYPQGTDNNDCQIGDCLSLYIEINDGVPCVYLTNDALGDQQIRVFGTREGLVLAEAEGQIQNSEWLSAMSSIPVMSRILRNKLQQQFSKGWVIQNDLAELNDCEPLPAPSEKLPDEALGDNAAATSKEAETFLLWREDANGNMQYTSFELLEDANNLMRQLESQGVYGTYVENSEGNRVAESQGGWEIQCYKTLLDFENRVFNELAPGVLFNTELHAIQYLQSAAVQSIVRDYKVFKLQTQDREFISIVDIQGNPM